MRSQHRLLILCVASLGATLLGGLILASGGPGNAASPPGSLVWSATLAAQSDRDVPVDPDFQQALRAWQRPVASTNATGRGRDSWLLDCRSGNVDFEATSGWCYESRLKLFYNTRTQILLDPLTGRLFSFDQNLPALRGVLRDTDESVEPPSFRVAPGATAKPLSRTCTTEDVRLVDQHVSGLKLNAARADSPSMKQFFTQQAQWWTERCRGP
jgi:hypothetical protein